MTNELKDKLKKVLMDELKDESQVVYILSRVRKIIELERTRKSYKIVNIFCNWALHSRIDRTEDIQDILEEFVEHKELRHMFLSFAPFSLEFKSFIKTTLNIELSTAYLMRFMEILRNVVSDTPITLTKKRIITITINPSRLPKHPNTVGYSIHED